MALFRRRTAKKNETPIQKESTPKESPQEQKEFILSRGEVLIFLPKEIEQTSTTTDISPKGLTGIIASAYGQTPRMQADVNTISNPTTIWAPDKFIIDDDGLIVESNGQTILFNQIKSVKTITPPAQRNSLLVVMAFKNGNSFSVKTLMPLGLEALIKERIVEQDESEEANPQETSSNNEEKRSSDADELMKYAELYEKGLLTEEEFNAKKKEILGL